ncbi:MAG: hypothetical protein M3495_16010 [Pseudomonadota bacterium]|nr:hypothetical protein [Pseudomonadota bacterium]
MLLELNVRLGLGLGPIIQIANRAGLLPRLRHIERAGAEVTRHRGAGEARQRALPARRVAYVYPPG